MKEFISSSDEMVEAINVSKSIAKEYNNAFISPAHLLKALIHKSFPLRSQLETNNFDVFYLDDWADFRIKKITKSTRPVHEPELDQNAKAVLREADLKRIEAGAEKTELIHVLLALCIPGVGFTYEQLKSLTLSEDELIKAGLFRSAVSNDASPDAAPVAKPNAKAGVLDAYCIDKTEWIEKGNYDPIKCREKEIRIITETLCRRTKPNAIIVGEPGVGKSALIDGLAHKILGGKVPPKLINARIFELDFGSLIAGASFKGEVEDRLKKILTKIKTFQNAILFIDEIHLLLDKQGGAAGAANLLKPEIARGGITIIGATTHEEYAKYVETDEAFRRRFAKIVVNEPDETDAFEMLSGVIPRYSSHHSLEISDNSIREAIKLAKRFTKDRKLPDSAIDLIDKSMAAVNIYKETAATELDELLAGMNCSDPELITDDPFNDGLSEKIVHSIGSQINYLLLAKSDFDADSFKNISHTDYIVHLKNILLKFRNILSIEVKTIEADDLYSVIAYSTGIPIGKLRSSEQERLLTIEAELQKRVIGQDQAIKEIAQAIRRARAGLRKQNKPVGSFFLVGPTGTGKTELARTLADYLFQDENAMLRFDMSEFTEEASVSLLHGASPGYVGYEEGGLLVNQIRQKPYSVVLFDEIEKAHPSVFKIFFQVLDEGKLHDKLGKEGDFTNAIILFTSNIGSDIIIKSFEKEGKLLGENALKEEMKKYFQPAFINRLDKIIPFAPIQKEIVHLILNLHLNKVRKILTDRNITLTLADKATELLSAMGYNIEYGARPVIGVIRDYIETPLSNMIIGGELTNNATVTLDVNDNNQFIWECATEE